MFSDMCYTPFDREFCALSDTVIILIIFKVICSMLRFIYDVIRFFSSIFQIFPANSSFV